MSAVMSKMSRLPQLAPKDCGSVVCPNDVKNLWAKAHLAVMRWDELQEHPDCPELRKMVSSHMEMLRAATKIAEPVMEARLQARLQARPVLHGMNPDCT